MSKQPDPLTRAEKTAQVLERLRAGVANLVTSDDWARMLAFQASFHSYSFRNTILIAAQCRHATRVAGFQTWLSLHRSVIKGERGIAILAPMVFKPRTAPSTTLPQMAATNDEDGAPRRLGFRVVHVFDVSQTEGDPLPSVARPLSGQSEPAQAAFQLLKRYAEDELHIPVAIRAMSSGGVNGYIDLSSRSIFVGEHLEPLGALKTLAHELGHAVLHGSDEAAHHDRASKEVEAESVAFVVLNALGFDSGDYSFGYVASWAQGDPKAVEAAGAAIARGAKTILAAVLKTDAGAAA
ncbi:MAG: ArdC-like ssDNA-binding domain-containing protein [Deltaproteobacteria bacterium]|nr:ArdC-like ssDNA-binding domain-containing protein [Deltaproteobacteria bacterium]